ncbi:hypothetical protein EK21DRAFT_87628 [Setomelanomma holmii]|uniref:Uncharacterized protein n=1 Tax=Setomelanomma holmii TaxID=210430 RepID=A0A9P4HBP9_9PLEO|nr:hypothetical protein EK21DRAFT_87628 [Setomelanomma holmii]
MENRKAPFGKSASMSTLQQNDQQSTQYANQPVYVDQYQALQQSPGFQGFRTTQTAKMWTPPFSGFLTPGSPWNNTSNGLADHGPSPFLPNPNNWVAGSGSSGSDATVTPDHVNNDLSGMISKASLNTNSIANTSWDKAITDIVAPRPTFRRYTADELLAIGASSYSNALRSTLLNLGLAQPESNGHLESTGERNANFPGSNMPDKSWLPGLGHPSLGSEKHSPHKDIYVPGGFAHHRRVSSRVSSLPAIPSPLGPRHYVDDLGSDVSGLVSPVPASSATKRRDQEKDDDSDSADDGLQIIGLDVPVRLTSDPDSPFFNPSISVHGHARKITDPFVDYENVFDDSPTPSPSMSKVARMPIPTARSGTNARQSSLALSPGRWVTREYANSPAPLPSQSVVSMSPGYVETPSPRKPDFRFTESTTPRTSSFDNFAQANDRVDLPIPPPPLSSVQGRLFHTSETRAQLDARADVRAEWIRTEAKKIADLGRLSFAAAQQYQQMGSQKDFELWQKFSKAYEDATNLEKRQEERRNMFMPQGMKAMRTGDENLAGDDSAAFTNGNHSNGDAAQVQGSLFGWKMAYMERVCAETKRRAAEKKESETDDDEITPNMLATLSKDEKKDLRKHLVARLEKATTEKAFV